MRKITFLMHVSLDGFVAGPNGEMNWIYVDEPMFDFVGTLTDAADAALYGRKTYEMMDAYWPEAGRQPAASKHDIEHSAWYNNVDKYVLSETLQSDPAKKLHIVSGNVAGQLNALKSEEGRGILMLGSPTAWRTVLNHALADEMWLFVNPVILGEGIRLFDEVKDKHFPVFVESRQFGPVTALHYRKP